MTEKNEPLVRLLAVEARPPSLQDNTGDLDRLLRALAPLAPGRPLQVPFSRLAAVARAFRRATFQGWAVANDLGHGVEVVDFLGGQPVVLPAVALDLGTTHLEAALVDLLSGRELGRDTEVNGQIEQGADILARIHFACRPQADGRPGIGELQQRVVASINRLVRRLAAAAGLEASAIRAMSVSGNTTMVHFLLGLDTFHLCREPYIPQVNAPLPVPAADLGLDLHPASPVWFMPGVGAYFGGDLISGIVAAGLDRARETCMLIDVGTNAEVVLGNRDWLIACAGAAGPALEGGVARMGMRAGPGAIDHVEVDAESGRVVWRTIGGEAPRGICGSGLIDLMAAFYLARFIDLRGKFRPAHLEAMGHRLVQLAEGPAFEVVPAAEAAGQRPVLVSQVDLDALMRSKAAMYAILTTLVHQVGVGFGDLARICVAGAFGRHIDPRRAITLGMLPDLDPGVYQPVGNSSLAGAVLALVDGEARRRCLEVARRITYLELNVNQEFMIRFSGSRIIPHTDRALFPSVPVFADH